MKPDLDLDSLIQRIREEATRPEYQAIGMPSPATDGADAFVSRSPAGSGHGAAGHRGGANTMPIAASVDELLMAGTDEAFVDQAYRTLLHRAPDTSGRDAMLGLLRSGHRRTYVLHVMQASDEARKVGANLPGMGRLPLVYRAAGKVGRGPLRPIAKAMDRVYSAWRHVRIAVNGVGMRRLDTALRDQEQSLAGVDSTIQAVRGDVKDLRGDLEHLRNDAQALRDDAQALRDDAQALRDDAQTHQDNLASLSTQLAEQGQRLAPLPQLAQEYRRELDLLRARINMLHRRTLPVLAAGAPAAGDAVTTAPGRDDLAGRIDAYYVSFEDAHRGSEDDIRTKLEGYIDHLARIPEAALGKPVVDIGCGRGEWLRLLSENGFAGIGVDLNPDMVARCRAQGLEAHHADALAWLASQEDESCSAISAFHIVEHLPFEVLFPLVEQAWRVLAPGGVLIMETPNPENVLVGSHTFYHDFSHRNPVTPTSLQFLVGYHGFAVSELLRLSPYPAEARVAENSLVADRVNGHFCGPQDYAVIAVKPVAPAEQASQDDSRGTAVESSSTGMAQSRSTAAETASVSAADDGPENDATGATA